MADLSQAATWHRQVAAMTAAADRAGVATADLPRVRARLLTQQSRLAEAAARAGAPLPALVPSPSEIATAGGALGDLTESAVAHTVRTMMSTLDAVDAALGVPVPTPALAPVGPPPPVPAPGPRFGPGPAPSPPAPPATRPSPQGTVPGPPPTGPHGTALVERAGQRPGLRNATVYGGFAVVVLAVQLGLFVVLDDTQLPLTAPLCLLVLPAFAWLGGFITIGVLFRSPPGEKPVSRTPRLGAMICALPDLLLCAGVAALFVANKVNG